MKTQTSKNQMYCPLAAIRYARVLYEVNVPEEAVQKTREIFREVPQLHETFVNPTIELKEKMNVVDRVFPEEIRNFLKVVCKYQRMDLIDDIFNAYDRYCDEQNQVLNAVLTCTVPPTEEQKKGMEAFLCKKYGAKKANIEVVEDRAILGGFILRAGSDEYDWSMKGRLNRLEERLTWR
nr:ATP synthase F1 subunit delta [uncultured Mediterraneibacter sp.]